MPGPNAPYTQLDEAQVIKQVFDETNDRLRVDAEVTATIGTVEVVITDADDAIKIGNGSGQYMAVNSDGSTNIRVSNALITSPFDYIGATYPNSTTEIYSYKSGGSGGSLVGVITVIYTDASKNNIQSVTKV